MSISDHFSLPFVGMKDGFHSYVFDVGQDFFAEFENAPINDGLFSVKVDVDKRSGHSALTFYISGHVSASCDRCLAEIRLPVNGEYELLVKVSNTATDDVEVIYIKDDQSNLYLGQVIYEFICLSLPLINKYDCESEVPKPCNEEVLSKLNAPDILEEESNQTLNIWTGLKNIRLDN
ncbi:MAG: DUF177 domain-containing protein [Saprospiraceae bacterium]|nr:DUF177 domain-containing protein [Saprospiraceae bacterium]